MGKIDGFTWYILNVTSLEFFLFIFLNKNLTVFITFRRFSIATIRDYTVNTLCRSCWTRKPRQQPRNRTVNGGSYRSTKRNRPRIARLIKRRARRESRRDDNWSRSEDEQCAPTRKTPIIRSRFSLLKRNNEPLRIESELERAIRSLGIAPPREY